MIQISLVFNTCPFPLLESHQGYHITFSCHFSLDTTWLWQCLILSLFLKVLALLKSSGWMLYRMSLNWFHLTFLLWSDWGCGSMVERPQRLKCHFIIPWQMYILSTWLILITWRNSVCQVSPLQSYSLFPLLHTVHFGKKSLYTDHMWEVKIVLHFFEKRVAT